MPSAPPLSGVPVPVTRASRAPPSQARSRATRLAASSSRAPGRRPVATASASATRTAWYIASSVSRPRQTRSMPAATASTAAVGIPCTALAACISSASLTTTPSKPSSPRSRPVTAAEENVAGRSPVSPGTRRCPGMMAKDPAAMAATNGGRSRVRSSASVPEIVASARCESPAVLPCPGKCLAHAATPALCRPATAAVTWRATRFGSDPKDRVPTTELPPGESTSAHGARLVLMPSRARSPPIAAYTPPVSATSSATPSAAFPG